MPTLILLYLLKANVVLLLFAAAYFGLLRRLTFFTLNRGYLVFALLFAAVYPALPVPALLPAEAARPLVFVITEAAETGAALAGPVAPAIDWTAVGLAGYAVGVAVLLGRLLVQLLSLGRLRRQLRTAVVHGLPVRVLAGAASPFSFWQTIYVNPAQHPAPELAAVLRHEQVHVRQWHTLDVLLAQLALAAAWCNPAAWLLRRALLNNLEYLADHAVLETGLVDRRAYQYSLLRLSQESAGPSLVSHFTFPTLKNRVAMMNTPFSSTGQLARYFVAGPLVLAMALGFSAARAQDAGPITVIRTASPATPAASEPKLVYVDGQRSGKTMAEVNPENIARIDVVKGDNARRLFGNEASKGVVVVTTKANQNRADVQAFNQKMTAVVAGTRDKAEPAAKARPITIQVRKDAQVAAPAKPNAGTKVVLRNPSIPAPAYYVDGQAHAANLNDINPKDIASVNVVKGDQARQLFGDDGINGVVIITTTANQDRADVRAFNEKTGTPVAAQKAEATPAQPKAVPYLAAPALAYITKNYPDARLMSMTEVPSADGKASNYKALLAIGRRPVSLLFDERGQFISEVPSNR